MKPSEIAMALEFSVTKTKLPPMIWGPPGVGKSRTVAQVAAKLDLGLIDRRLVLMDPVDLHGLPHVELIDPQDMDNGKRAAWAQPSFLPRGGRGVLFLDEFPQAPPAVQNAASQLILDRQLGDYRLPDGWSIVAAGNNATDRAATHKMPSHIASRFEHLDFEADGDDFTRWGLANGVRLEIISFLRFKPSLLHDFDAAQRAFPCPRSWEFCSQIMDAAPPAEIERQLYAGHVGPDAAGELVAFLKVFRTLPSVDQILLNPQTATVPTDPATLYAITDALARKATDANFASVVTYGNRLPSAFGVVLVTQSAQLCPDVRNTRAFVEWCASNSNVTF